VFTCRVAERHWDEVGWAISGNAWRFETKIKEARAFIGKHLEFYNQKRPNPALDDEMRDEAYFIQMPLTDAA